MSKKIKILLLFLIYFSNIIIYSQPENKTSSLNLIKESLPVVKDYLQQIKKLNFKKDIKTKEQTQDELRKILEKEIKKAYGSDYLTKWQKILIKLSLMKNKEDLNSLFITTYSSMVQAYYDPEKQTLFFLNAPLENPNDINQILQMFGGEKKSFQQFQDQEIFKKLVLEITLAHEMTHCLQDQNFNLNKITTKKRNNGDFLLARAALIEGDATVVQYLYVFKRLLGKNLSSDFLLNGAKIMRNYTGDNNSGLPEFFQQNIYFPYTKGFYFVAKILSEGGMDSVNKLFLNPPNSTEQILHPEKYKQKDAPQILKFNYKNLLSKKNYNFLDYDTMGEFNTYLILKAFLSEEDALKGAEGWDGDLLFAFENKKNKNITIFWRLIFDTSEDTKEFFNLYEELITKKYPDMKLSFYNEDKKIYKDENNIVYFFYKNTKLAIIESRINEINEDIIKKFLQGEFKNNE